MTIFFTTILAAIVAVATASDAVVGPPLVYDPITISYTSIYSQSTICSAPPSSLEVCLTSIFSSMESVLVAVHASLYAHEISIKQQMHHEHTLLYSEISWVYDVEKIAKSVHEAVYVDYHNLHLQIVELQQEKLEISMAYYYANRELTALLLNINQVKLQERSIYLEYKKVMEAQWSVYKYISAIRYEKSVVMVEIQEIQEVVAKLNIQIQAISAKIYQLTKRQVWLSEWQEKLYVELESFYAYVKVFKEVQVNLHVQEYHLVQQQLQLYAEAVYAKQVVAKLHLEYERVDQYLLELYAYQKRIEQVYVYVKGEASVFISAYKEFTCEDSLLYYLACSKSTVSIPKTSSPIALP